MRHLFTRAHDATHPTEGPRIAHIDGLRAIAVTSVVAYHSDLPGFYGGYVGVDIFFVISGFLIINQIVSEIREGRFSLATFYARRSLRILPPFLAMIVGSFLLALAILVPPYEWEWFGLSAVFSSLFASNFFFMTKQGYFDINALKKPLLHTWSLSVEEQFYIIAPLALIALFWAVRKRRIPPDLALMGVGTAVFVASLVGCFFMTAAEGPNRGFYMITWRAWEFVAGGAVAWAATAPFLRGNARLASGLGALGLLLVLLSVAIDLGDGFYPGYAAIVPVAGTALLLLSGLIAPDSPVARLLSLRWMVAIGLISYGWYLWHWPLISLIHISVFWSESTVLKTAMGLAALVPAVLSYRYLELPIRRWRRGRDLRALGWRPALAGLAMTLACAVIVGGTSGILYALERHAPEIDGNAALIPPPRTACRGEACADHPLSAGFMEGDSHAARMFGTLLNESTPFNVARIERFRANCPLPPGMPPDMGDCPAARAAIDRAMSDFPPGERFWIVERLWSYMLLKLTRPQDRPFFIKAIEDRLKLYSDGGRNRLLVIGAIPDFPYLATECIYRAERYGLGWDYCGISRKEIDETTGVANRIVRDIVTKLPNARFIDPVEMFCDKTLCRPYVERSILYRDNNHLSLFGADWLYAKLRPHMVWAMTGKEVSAGLAR
ncbi:MAG: acyltransferase family protein [Flavobacteriaceae bacterium]